VDGIIYHEVEAIFVGRKMRKEYAGGVFGGDLQVRIRQYLLQLVDIYIYRLFAESRYLSKEGLRDTLNSLVVIIRYSSKKTRSSSGTTTELTQQRQKEWNSPLRDCIEKRDHFALNCQARRETLSSIKLAVLYIRTTNDHRIMELCSYHGQCRSW